MDERLNNLETRVAYQERLIESLNEVIREFATRVETLERRVRSLAEGGLEATIGPAQEKPPHY